MKEERILRYTLEEIENLPDDTDWERVDAMTDEEVMQAALSDKDAQPTDEAFWKDAVRALLENYLYVETDVLAKYILRTPPRSPSFIKRGKKS